MSLTHEQKAAIEGGLQQHSVGALYPLLVVGIDHPKYGLRWAVQNLQTGAYAVYERSLFGPSGYALLSWHSAEGAADFVERARERGHSKGTWLAGELRRDIAGVLYINPQQETPRQAFYNSHDTDTDSI